MRFEINDVAKYQFQAIKALAFLELLSVVIFQFIGKDQMIILHFIMNNF